MHGQPSDTKPTLLLVEDEQDTARLITLIMGKEGYRVVHAADGREALRVIGSMPPPTLVLLDIHLPHVNGIQVLDTIRTKPDWDNIPVVMLTAVADEPHVREAFSLSVKDYVVKPFKPEALVSYLKQLCNPPPQRQAS